MRNCELKRSISPLKRLFFVYDCLFRIVKLFPPQLDLTPTTHHNFGKQYLQLSFFQIKQNQVKALQKNLKFHVCCLVTQFNYCNFPHAHHQRSIYYLDHELQLIIIVPFHCPAPAIPPQKEHRQLYIAFDCLFRKDRLLSHRIDLPPTSNTNTSFDQYDLQLSLQIEQDQVIDLQTGLKIQVKLKRFNF